MEKFGKILFAGVCLAVAVSLSTAFAEDKPLSKDAPLTLRAHTQTVYAAANHEKSGHRAEKAPKITYDQAVDIALQEIGGGQVTSVDLEHEKHYGTLVYEVEVKKDYSEFEVYIDAETGKVLQVKRD